jgi:hypothetical protein
VAEAAANITSVRKKSLSQALVKKVTELTPLQTNKNKPSVTSICQDMASMCIMPKPAVDCHGWMQRPWLISLMVVCFCVCVCLSHGHTKTWFFTHGRTKVVQNTKTSNKKGHNCDAVYDHAMMELP